MNSPFANLFMAIRQQIADNVSDIVFIDQDLGQLNIIGKNSGRLPVQFPCVLIDFEDFCFENLSNNVQTAKGNVVLKLGFATHSNSMQVTPDTVLQKALDYYYLEFLLHKFIQGWSPDDNCFGSLNRISSTVQKRSDNYRVREIRYSIAFDDYSTKPTVSRNNVSILINEEMIV